MTKTFLAAASLALVLHAPDALAQKKRGPPKPTPARAAENCKEMQGDQLEACKVIGAYLDLWKQKKWPELRKLIHPKTLEEIATTKKNLGSERHRMAPWYWAKGDFLLTEWTVESVEDAPMGTVVIHTVEQSYRVEEDGMEEGEKNAYIAGRSGGKWFIVDRRSGGGGFDKTAIKIGMKGYFDPVAEEAPPAEKAAD